MFLTRLTCELLVTCASGSRLRPGLLSPHPSPLPVFLDPMWLFFRPKISFHRVEPEPEPLGGRSENPPSSSSSPVSSSSLRVVGFLKGNNRPLENNSSALIIEWFETEENSKSEGGGGGWSDLGLCTWWWWWWLDSAKSLEKEILGLLHGRDLWSEFWLAEAEEEEVAEEEYMSKHAMGVVETTD